MSSKTSIILRASGFALFWVTIVTCTMFPDILTKGKTFLTEQYDFEYVGRGLLFALGVYIFDLMIQVLYAIDKRLNKMFVVNILSGLSISVLTIALSKDL